MRKAKTIKGVIGKVRQVAAIDVEEIKSFERMTQSQKEILIFLVGEAYNFISEIERIKIPRP